MTSVKGRHSVFCR